LISNKPLEASTTVKKGSVKIEDHGLNVRSHLFYKALIRALALLANDVVEAMTIFTVPVVLGGGKKLFADGSAPHAYKLTRSRVSSTGIMIGHYERDGEIKIGGTALDSPSEREIARRMLLVTTACGAARGAQGSQQRRFQVRGHLYPGRVAHDARHLAVRRNERLASRTCSDVRLDGRAHIRG
jgi:hypothetical protein